MLARSITQLRSEHGRAILYHLLGNMATIIAHDKKHKVREREFLIFYRIDLVTTFVSKTPFSRGLLKATNAYIYYISYLLTICNHPLSNFAAIAVIVRAPWLSSPQRHPQHDARVDEESH